MPDNLPDPTGQNLVRCEITDRMVPEDETVILNGMRVSAEGKELLMEQIRTGERMPGELEAPGWLRRLGCTMLDGLVLIACGFCLGMVVGGAMLAIFTDETSQIGVQAVAELLAGCLNTAYFAIMYAVRGQSLGKIAGKIKVTRLDGSPIRGSQAIIRALAYVGPNLIGPVVTVVMLMAGAFTSDSPAPLVVIGGIGVLVFAYWVANVICVLAHPQRRALHDLIAGTRVIMYEN